MPAKATGRGALAAVERFDGGLEWIAHPDETMQRASHALVRDGEVWLVDPVDADGLDDELTDYGTVAGVVVLFNYHRRHAAAIASRHDVPVYLPAGMTALADDDVDAPVERVEGEFATTGFRLRPVVTGRLWQEWALFDGETLYIPESVGTAAYFRAPGERLGVSLFRRVRPPRSQLGSLTPERVLVGHGHGVYADATGALHAALAAARRTAPRLYVRYGPTVARNLYVATVR